MRRASEMALGLAVIGLGIVLLLSNFDLLSVGPGYVFNTYWPVLLMVWGFVAIIEVLMHRRQGIFFPLLVFAVGGLILGNKLQWWNVGFNRFWDLFWPVVIILIGWSFLRQGAGVMGRGRLAVWNTSEFAKEGWELSSDHFLAFMGGITIDLTKAKIPEGTTTLRLTAVMGGIDVIVPDGLDMACSGSAVLGGVDFLGEDTGGLYATRTMQKGESGPPRILFACNAVMGGISITKPK
ncbi:MAG: LiaF-related protein [Limnochordia bacterium]|nr:cell wall-active antibiotics response protein [Limnochordia bacterium]MDD2629519.1 LiaF-related protein [Limnochordia bacterium]